MTSPRVDLAPALGLYLAGLVDGEGCFSIQAKRCEFVLKMRDDDRPLLEGLREECGGIGSLRTEAGGTGNDRNRRPQARWTIAAKRELVWLTELFDMYPLRSKKARDYAIWREAVLDWYMDAPRFAEHQARMQETRAYAVPA